MKTGYFQRGFYLYLAMLVFVAFLFGFEMKARIDGDPGTSAYDVWVCFFWLVGVVYLVIDEHKLKETYVAIDEEKA